MAKKETDVFGKEVVKKRGGATRQRKFPGIKGPRPDKAAKRRAESVARAATSPPRPEWEHPETP